MYSRERSASAEQRVAYVDEVHHSVMPAPAEVDQRAPWAEQVVVIGAGPAGLTAAHELAKLGHKPIVLEKSDKVGGISCTENYKGFYFDMGGHRFFSKVPEVTLFWEQVLGEKLLRRPRSSRIYYNRRFFAYPLKPFNTLAGLGIWQSILIVLSYLKWQLFPYRREDTFEQWVTNRFGRRLFETFFKTYTEKLWGIPCSELKAEWAAQRIKDLSLKTAVLNMFFKPRKAIKTLIEEFHYPQCGPGMFWSAVKGRIEREGGEVRLSTNVLEFARNGRHIESVTVASGEVKERLSGRAFLSSMPLREFVEKLSPPPPEEILAAARRLKYRDFLTVCLIIDRPSLFPDNWIYIHDPSVKVGRIQNFKNWSPYMVPVASKTSLGLEYFCTEGDQLWNMADKDLIELGKTELRRIGLANYEDVEDGCVYRVPKAYPVYDSDYRESLPVIREYVNGLDNFVTVGRNGLHRYNNQDHAMLTGMLGAKNLAAGEKNDLWSVNDDQEYHEEIHAIQSAIAQAFPKLDRIALGLATGTTMGAILFVATLFLVLKGGSVVGPTMGLLDQFFPGYTVSLQGSFLGLLYGFATGFAGGWVFAFFRNAAMFLTAAYVRRGSEFQTLKRLLEYM